MNKFIIGDLIYLPQGTVIYADYNRLLGSTTNKPTVATYLGKEDKFSSMHRVEMYGSELYLSDNEIETLNFARKDVYKANTIN